MLGCVCSDSFIGLRALCHLRRCRPLLLIYQSDVTTRIQLEATIARLTESHLETLSEVSRGHTFATPALYRVITMCATSGGRGSSTEFPVTCIMITRSPSSLAPSHSWQMCQVPYALYESSLSYYEDLDVCMPWLQLFPRHVIEHLSAGVAPASNLGHLARSHSEVSVLFLDIVGK